MNQPDEEPTDLTTERPGLLNLAYRFLGSRTEAEDVIQETYARWYAMSDVQQSTVESPGAWLTTVASRICLDLLGSARARRERYVGEWLPEPLPQAIDWIAASPGGTELDPADRVTLDESISMAFLVVLESMTPAERVTFILHDVFRYAFDEVATMVGRTPAACRQLASSARRRIERTQPSTSPMAEQADIVRSFKQAWDAKDVQALVALLDPMATVTADGGGLVKTVVRPIEGGENIARYYIGLAHRTPAMTMRETTVNGEPGLIGEQDNRVVTVYAFDIADGQIKRMWAIRNPNKLRPWIAR